MKTYHLWWKGLGEGMCHHKEKERATSSVGFWEALGQKGVNRILKVVIVSLLYLIS